MVKQPYRDPVYLDLNIALFFFFSDELSMGTSCYWFVSSRDNAVSVFVFTDDTSAAAAQPAVRAPVAHARTADTDGSAGRLPQPPGKCFSSSTRILLCLTVGLNWLNLWCINEISFVNVLSSDLNVTYSKTLISNLSTIDSLGKPA